MNVMPIYDRSMYYWFVRVSIESSLVVRWLEVELLSGLRFLLSLLCDEGVWVVNYRNRVDCEAMCTSLSRFYRVVRRSV